MTPSASRVARAGSSFGILIGIGLSHATRPLTLQALAKQKTRRADVPAPGFEHPGLLASCLTWLASRPAQIDHDDVSHNDTVDASSRLAPMFPLISGGWPPTTAHHG